MFFTNFFYVAGVVFVIIFALWLIKKLGTNYPIGCIILFIVFTVFCIKTCRELDEEEALEQRQREELMKELEKSSIRDREKLERLHGTKSNQE